MSKILKFGTAYCTQCKALDKVLNGLNLPVDYIDAEESDELVEKYNIKSVPVLIFLDNNGTEQSRLCGFQSGDTILSKYKELDK